MQPTHQQRQYLLTEKRNQEIFEQGILISSLPYSSILSNPRAIFLGGQSGSGKSALAKYQLSRFPNSERAVVINSDALREYHPHFSALQKTDVNQASFLVNPDTVKWQQKLITAAVQHGRNLILDGTLGGNPAPIQATLQRLRDAGYYLQISVLAVAARLSRLGMENHDRLCEEIPRTLTLLEANKAVDEIQIFRRQTDSSPLLFYQNYFRDGRWNSPPEAATMLAEGRNYRWTPDEEAAFLSVVDTVAERMRQRGVSNEDIDNFYRYVECPR